MATTGSRTKARRSTKSVSPENLITYEEAAQTYNVSERTIRNWVQRGLLTVYVIGPRLKRIDKIQLSQLAVPVQGKGVA
ncbi:helix-turn-helix domain-containing protein [Nocardia sp. NPDC052001]|uniref:helix-turn-helix domain-containing protein n=1 Tax=Nocardia sp. NPDC052001 TaxID=3154853 RepID=UPI00341A96AD